MTAELPQYQQQTTIAFHGKFDPTPITSEPATPLEGLDTNQDVCPTIYERSYTDDYYLQAWSNNTGTNTFHFGKITPEEIGALQSQIPLVIQKLQAGLSMSQSLDEAGIPPYAQQIIAEKLPSQLAQEGILDPLTGVYNKRGLNNALKKEQERSQRTDRPYSIIMLDLDHFKNINDTYGHPEGDQVLQEVCNLLLGIIRSTDPFGRYGGEEFMILLPETNGEDAMNVAEKLRTAIETHQFKTLERKIIPVTASFGVLQANPNQSKEKNIAKVDAALYAAKGLENPISEVLGKNLLPVITEYVKLLDIEGIQIDFENLMQTLINIESGNRNRTIQYSPESKAILDLLELIKLHSKQSSEDNPLQFDVEALINAWDIMHNQEP